MLDRVEKSLHGLDVIVPRPVGMKKLIPGYFVLLFGQVGGITRYVNGILTSLIIEIRLYTKIFLLGYFKYRKYQ